MAKVKNGLVIGRVGHLVYYVRDGQQCVRSFAPQQKKPQSQAQRLQQAKFTAVQRWLTPLNEFFRSFNTKNSRNTAFSNSLKNACVVDGENISIDASKMVLAKGPLCSMENGTVTTEGHRLNLTWSNNASLLMSNATDRMIWVLYNPKAMAYLSNIGAQSLPHRFECGCTIDLPETAKGCYHLYTIFSNIHRTAHSDSVYLGEVKV